MELDTIMAWEWAYIAKDENLAKGALMSPFTAGLFSDTAGSLSELP